MSLRSNGHNIKVPRIYEDLDLSEYAEGLPTIKVWVNPPRRLLQRFDKLQETMQNGFVRKINRHRSWRHKITHWIKNKFVLPAAEDDIVGWYAKVWSGDGHSGFSEGEVLEFARTLFEEDPALLTFMMTSTWELILSHRENAKKN